MNYIGIDLGGTNIKAALVTQSGEILREDSCPTEPARGTEAVTQDIAALIRRLSADTEIAGVGIGCPGTVDDECGRVAYACNLGWSDYDLRTALLERTGFAVRLVNDANAAALGEALVGCGRGARSVIVVTLGTGIGGGIVLDGHLLAGYAGAAGELGHMVIDPAGALCGCGRRGCFETLASATALIRAARRAMDDHPDSILHTLAARAGEVNAKLVFDAAAAGDGAAAEVVARYIDALACGVTNLVNIFDPELIAFSGGVANQGEALLAPLRRQVEKARCGGAYLPRRTRLEQCTLGYRAGVIGAALYAATNERSVSP